ncbi:MAG: hypothetical protein OSA06_06450, partial [Acidimicrobiales bacterium]|nr:hypothetical protein [Acidimicrobiales bacterium]
MKFRRPVVLVLTVFTMLAALLATPATALEYWEATTEAECAEASGEWDGLYCNEVWVDCGDDAWYDYGTESCVPWDDGSTGTTPPDDGWVDCGDDAWYDDGTESCVPWDDGSTGTTPP